MSIRLILGGSGQGKTSHIIEEVICRSIEQPSTQFFVIVPEQFSLEMQRNIALSHPDHGYMNIDVLSFYRLAYRVFDECGYEPEGILEDLGVTMILRKILTEHEDEFPGLKKSRRQPGFLDELKSVLMEFICYGVSFDMLKETGESLTQYPLLLGKCQELSRLYEYFENSIKGRFMVTEQILDVLCDLVPESKLLSGAVFYLDGFTGFTPVQLSFLEELVCYADQLNITVTIPAVENGYQTGEELFHFSRKTIQSLFKIGKESGTVFDDPVCLFDSCPKRFLSSPELMALERNIFRSKREIYEDPLENIHVISCMSPEQEAEYIVHRIEYLVRKYGYRYREIAVLTGDLNEYSAAFERQAGLLNIPLFTDIKKKMSYHPSIETIRALFHLVERNYSYESVFRYLKSGMSDLSDEETDFLEDYVIASGIRGYSMWKKPFIRRLNRYRKEEREQLEELRLKILEETEAFYLAWKDQKSTVRERMAALYQQMCRLDYPGKLARMADQEEKKGNYVREKEYREIFSLLLVLLDKIVAIFDEECLSTRELSEIMDAGMESLGLGVVPLSMDQVILGDLKRTRLPDIRVLFIAGLNEGLIPPAIHEGGILSVDDKQILSQHGILLANGPEEQSLEDEFYMYLAFTRPKEALYFTCADVGRDGKTWHPSPVLSELSAIFPKLKPRTYPGEEKRYYFNPVDSREYLLRGLADPASHMDEKAMRLLLSYWMARRDLHEELERYFMERDRQRSPRYLSQAVALTLYGQEIRGSVTRLERYAACPYQYFCIYGLGLAAREEYEVSAIDIGNLFHRALEYFSKEVKRSDYSWKTLPEDYQEDLLDRAVAYAVDDGLKCVLNDAARNQYKMYSVRRILARSVRIIKLHLADSDLEPDRFELHFGKTDRLKSGVIPLSEDVMMYLEGMIDRIDIYEDGESVLVRVIDYKSGTQEFDMDDLYHGLQLQLVLYMKVAREIYGRETGKAVIPAGMYYYQLKDPIFDDEKLSEESMLRKFRMSGYTNSDPQILDKIERGSSDLISALVKIKKDGDPYSYSRVLSGDDLELLEDFSLQKAVEIGKGIYAGEIDPCPFQKDKKTACDYCPFLSVCGFDLREGSQYNTWKKKSAEEALDAIRKQVD